jgi:diadenosine tetraphosphate (Ap4A) HIT family hydrolase
MKKKFVDTSNPQSRPTGEYAKVISDIAEHGVCPFCPEHLAKYHKNPIAEKKYWLVTDNMYPNKPSRHHILIIHKGHISHINELSPAAWSELHAILSSETSARKISGGTFLMRFGETRFTGASVSHLHAHIIQSDPDDPSYDAVKGLLTRIG